MEQQKPPIAPMSNMKVREDRKRAIFRPSLIWGEGHLNFSFILSKIAILNRKKYNSRTLIPRNQGKLEKAKTRHFPIFKLSGERGGGKGAEFILSEIGERVESPRKTFSPTQLNPINPVRRIHFRNLKRWIKINSITVLLKKRRRKITFAQLVKSSHIGIFGGLLRHVI